MLANMDMKDSETIMANTWKNEGTIPDGVIMINYLASLPCMHASNVCRALSSATISNF